MSVTKVQLVGNVSTGASFAGLNVVGVLTATSFSGDGSGLTGVGLGTTGSINTSGIITATSFFGSGSGLTGVGLGSTGSINTSGIITASSFFGSGANLTGVSGVSTTGSVNTSGIITATSIVVSAGTTALPSISPTGDSNTGIFFPAADTIAFAEGGAEAMRVDSSGRLLIGISTSGNANGGILQLTSGITFPATAVAATDVNTLDDYEEGTWTPVDSSGAGLSFSSAGGFYTKIGRTLTCFFYVTFPSTANVSVAAIGGLPFTTGNNVAGGVFTGAVAYNTYGSLQLVGPSSVTYFNLSTPTGSDITNANMSLKVLRGSFLYFV